MKWLFYLFLLCCVCTFAAVVSPDLYTEHRIAFVFLFFACVYAAQKTFKMAGMR